MCLVECRRCCDHACSSGATKLIVAHCQSPSALHASGRSNDAREIATYACTVQSICRQAVGVKVHAQTYKLVRLSWHASKAWIHASNILQRVFNGQTMTPHWQGAYRSAIQPTQSLSQSTSLSQSQTLSHTPSVSHSQSLSHSQGYGAQQPSPHSEYETQRLRNKVDELQSLSDRCVLFVREEVYVSVRTFVCLYLSLSLSLSLPG
jgi:hypothetical protein